MSRSLGSPCVAWHCLRPQVSLLFQLSRRALPVEHVTAQWSRMLPPSTAACGPVAEGVPMKGSGSSLPVAALFPGMSWPWHCFQQSQCRDFRRPCSQVIVHHCFQCLCSQLGRSLANAGQLTITHAAGFPQGPPAWFNQTLPEPESDSRVVVFAKSSYCCFCPTHICLVQAPP